MRVSNLLPAFGMFCLVAFGSARAESLSKTFSFQPATVSPNIVAVNPITNRVYVALKGTVPVTLSVLDGATLTPLQTNGTVTFMNTDTNPQAIVINPLTNLIYVVCQSGTVVVVDGSTNSISSRITVGTNPVAAGFNLVTSKLYVANNGSANITVVDTKNNNATQTVTVGTNPISVAVNSVTNRIFVANNGSNSVSIIDGSNDTVAGPISPVNSPIALAVNPQNNTLYVAGSSTVSNNAYAVTFSPAPTIFPKNLGSTAPNAVAVNSLNGKAYFTLPNGTFKIFNTDLSTQLQSYSLGSGCADVAVNTSTNKVYAAANLGSFTLEVIDGATDARLTSVTTPGSASSPISINTATNRVYMLNTNSAVGQIFMIDGASNVPGTAAGGVSGTKFAVNSTSNLIYALDAQPNTNGTVRVLDGSTAAATQLYTVAVGIDSQDIRINNLTGEVYVSNRGSNTITVISAATPPTTSTITVGNQPTALAVNAALNRVYVATTPQGPALGSVMVFSGATKSLLSTISIAQGLTPALIAVNPVNNKFYVACRAPGNGSLSIYNADNSPVPGMTPQLAGNPNDIEVDPVTNKVFVTFTDDMGLAGIDGTTNNLQILPGNTVGGNSLGIDSANGRLYIVSSATDKFQVASALDPNQILVNGGSLGSGMTASGIVVNSTTGRAFVALGAGQVAVLDGTASTPSLVTLAGGPANGIALNPATGRVYLGGNPIRTIDVETTGLSGPVALLSPTSFSGQLSYDSSPVFTSNSNAAGVTLYYQVDTLSQTWQKGTPGSPGAFSVSLSNLTAGSHTIYTFATDGTSATIATAGNGTIGHGSTITVGKIGSYSFIVHSGPTATINPIPALTINEDAGSSTINLTGITAGPLGGVPSLTVTAVSSNANIIANPITVSVNAAAGTGSFSFSPVADANGSVQVLVTVTDNNASTPAAFKSISTVLNVTVNPVNDAPTFTLGADITVSEAPVAKTVTNFVSNIVLGPANESTQQISKYIVVASQTDQFLVQPAISNAGTLTFTPANRADTAAAISISVQLQDDGGTAFGGQDTSAPVTFHITLTPNADTLIVKNTQDVAPPTAPVADSLRDCMERARAGDTITFDPDVFALDNSDAATVINTRADLPHLNRSNITIDASNRRVTINGSAAGSASGFSIESNGNKLINLSIINFQSSGISVGPNASNNTIGGDRTVGTGVNGQGLRLAGNGAFGINLTGPNTTGNVIKGCWIGLDAGGSQAQANLAGIILQAGAAQNTIGGSTSGEGNVISGNFFEGITVSGTGSDSNTLIGNVIGASAVPTTSASRSVGSRDDTISSRSDVANGSAGMFISRGTTSTQAGGSNSGEGNTIANNGGNGVEVRTTNSKKNTVRGNSIGKNKRGGITLFDGSNNGIQAPTISSVLTIGGRSSDTVGTRTTSTVRVIGTSTTTGTIEIFNDSSDQGSSLLGRSSVSSDLSFTADVTADTTQNITATLTDTSGNTSTFAVYTASTGGGTGSATDTDGDGFPDELETALGSDPNSASSTPFPGNAAAGTTKTLSGVTLAAKLNFAKTTLNDSLTFSATLDIGTASLAGQTVVVDVGGIIRSFTLNSSGKSTTKGLTMSKPKNGSTKLILKLTKATLAASLSDEGLTGDADIKTAVSKTVTAIVLFNSGFYTATKTVSYTAKKGLSGTAK